MSKQYQPQDYTEVRKAFDRIGEIIEEAQKALRGSGLLPEEPPEDPRERALWLKQNRNTGPEKPNDWRKR